MVRLSWIIQVGPKCHHKVPYGRETEEDLTTYRRKEGYVTMEAKA